MIFSPHMITGGALGAVTKASPVISFSLGFISHYLLDIIPHWDYKLLSSTKSMNADPLDGTITPKGRPFLIDLSKIALDIGIGFVIILYFFRDFSSIHGFFTSSMLWGAFGGIAPDILQFVYYQVKREPLTSLQKFHIYMHSHKRLDGRYILGPLLQLLFVTLIIIVAKMFHWN